MVRTTKGGRVMNPADAFRKEQRKKEIQRNKLERKYTREAVSNRDKPEEIKKQLQEIIDVEEAGPLNKALKLRKKVLQEAYEAALVKKKEDDLKKKQVETAASFGTDSMRPEDSRYYHPVLNPTGAPPPGKHAAGLVGAPAAGSSKMPGHIPLPKPPPLPSGPAPKLPPPPAAPPLPAGAPPTAPGEPLPPPDGPPPGFPGGPPLPPPPLPPPLLPPPGWRLPPPTMPPPIARLPPPPGPPPLAAPSQPTESEAAGEAAGAGQDMPLPPPSMPPPGMPQHFMPPPHMPPPGYQPPLPPPTMPPPAYAPPTHQAASASTAAAASAAAPKVSATITGSSTVVKRPLAQNDRALTSMVPASVRVRREDTKPRAPARPVSKPADFGFGLAPIQRSAITSAPDIDSDAPKPRLAPPSRPPPVGWGAASQPKPVAAKPAAPKQQATPVSTDAQYQEFLATMKELGAV